MNLLKAEIKRCLRRRLGWILGLTLVGFLLLSVGVVAAQSSTSDYNFSLQREMPTFFEAWLLVFGFVVLVWAASVIGAEWSSGNMSNMLLWHPNRMTLWAAKATAIVAVAVVATLVLLMLTFGLFASVGLIFGETGELSGSWWLDLAALTGRWLVLIVFMALAGAGIAMWGRHTAVATTVVAAYMILNPIFTWGVLGGVFSVTYPGLYSLLTYADAWLQGGVAVSSIFFDSSTQVSAGSGFFVMFTVIAVLMTAASVSFQRRDI
ncbi:ABC transporter permease subunit [Natronoglycomyces albus]|uniref:ABC transporter permease subunit n=1 Tax=Natronoglycomyces albus TaxID=2811108 RepID=A0A895XKE3_9ACTN|nr:ABC transporter permease subunit [Natronoglycomyces albus]QSB04282.1 ABC transporter permease subunit [Natronoglycomyces albus]